MQMALGQKRINDIYDLKDSIYTIGDSTSYGLNINYKDTYTNLLAKQLKLKILLICPIQVQV